MRYQLSLLVILILFSQCEIFGQKKFEKQYRQFSILIINPDSISMHDSLKSFIPMVESEFRESYYSFITELETVRENEPEQKKQENKIKIQRVKLIEMDVHSAIYVQFISMLTCSELFDLFNAKHNPDFSFDFISRDELFSYDPIKITNYYEVDYLLTYKGITTPIENGEPVLKIELQLFDRKKSKIIYENTSYGHSGFYKDNSGILKACSNDLQCMLKSGIISSSKALFEFIERRQKK